MSELYGRVRKLSQKVEPQAGNLATELLEFEVRYVEMYGIVAR